MKKKKSTGGKKPASRTTVAPVSKYPTSWYFMHTGDCTLDTLRAYFQRPDGPDVEVWRELGIVELTWPDKTFTDFQQVPCSFEDDEASNAFLAQHGIQTLYWVTVEPVCDDAGLARLQQAAQQLGGMFCADTSNFEPILKGE
jgi:hypothetical protein